MGRNNFYKKFLAVALVLVLAVLLNTYLLKGFWQNFIYGAIKRPALALSSKLANVSVYKNILNAGGLIRENQALKEENQSLSEAASKAALLSRENDALRNQLGVSHNSSFQLKTVQLFAIGRSGNTSTANIDRGSADGIAKGMPVIADGNVFVGLVENVYKNTASVIMLDDPRVKVSVGDLDGKIVTTAQGELGGKLKLELLTEKDEVAQGDLLVTNGLDGVARGLLVAKVSDIGNPGSGLFKKVEASQVFDLSVVGAFFVILSK